MPGFPDPRRRVELDRDLHGFARNERLRCRVRVSMREVQDPPRHERRGPVREHVAELRRHEGHRSARGDRELDPRVPHDLERFAGGRPVVDEGESLVGTLVPRLAERQVRRAPDRAGDSDVAADMQRVFGPVGAVDLAHRPAVGSPRAGARVATRARTATRPRRTRGPRAAEWTDGRTSAIGGSRSTPLSSPRNHRCHHRIISGTWSIRGPGIENRGTHVAPGTEEQSLRPRQPLEASESHVVVAVGVTGDDHRRRFDRLVAVEPHRSVSPIPVLALMLEPREEPGLGRVDSSRAIPRASRRRRRSAPVAARSSRPSASGSRGSRSRASRHPRSGRRPCSGGRSRRSG